MSIGEQMNLSIRVVLWQLIEFSKPAHELAPDSESKQANSLPKIIPLLLPVLLLTVLRSHQHLNYRKNLVAHFKHDS